jgi:hypothetical protein
VDATPPTITSKWFTRSCTASGPTSIRLHAATAAGSNSYTYNNNGNTPALALRASAVQV